MTSSPIDTPARAARKMSGPIGDVGGRWMLSPEVLGPCKDYGYPNGFVYYGVGRGGVLGDVDADVVIAAFGFFQPAVVRGVWEAGVAVEGPRNSAVRYGAACATYGQNHLHGFTGAARFVELAERLIDGAPVSGLSLFAGWRAERRPDEIVGRAYFLAHVLREWRGSAHVLASVASGLTPLESILAAHGAERAKMFGWGDTFDDVSHLIERREACEDLTDEICAVALRSTLSAEEQVELVALVDAMHAGLH